MHDEVNSGGSINWYSSAEGYLSEKKPCSLGGVVFVATGVDQNVKRAESAHRGLIGERRFGWKVTSLPLRHQIEGWRELLSSVDQGHPG
jgi:hypothetical protein